MRSELKPVNDYGANMVSPYCKSQEFSLNAYVTFITCVQDKTFVGLGSGQVHCYKNSSTSDPVDPQIFSVRGLPICAAINASNNTILVGTDNSELLEISDNLNTQVSLDNGWIEHVAVSKSGSIAYSVNKTCYILSSKGDLSEAPQAQGSVTGLQFNSNGTMLAIARYDGVALWDVSSAKIVGELEHKGAHLNLTWSQDENYLVTSTMDKEILCWELSTKSSFRMRGYPSKIRSFCWSADGKHLAAAGADSVTVWPFTNGNPSGKPPYEFGYSFEGTVTEVAAHPTEPIIAAGYDNGTVLIGKYLKGEAIIARTPSDETVSAINWSPQGDKLFIGTDKGSFSRVQLEDFDF